MNVLGRRCNVYLKFCLGRQECCPGGRVDGWIHGWMDEWMSEQMSEQMNECSFRAYFTHKDVLKGQSHLLI